jgi:hypothetical protein
MRANYNNFVICAIGLTIGRRRARLLDPGARILTYFAQTTAT